MTFSARLSKGPYDGKTLTVVYDHTLYLLDPEPFKGRINLNCAEVPEEPQYIKEFVYRLTGRSLDGNTLYYECANP